VQNYSAKRALIAVTSAFLYEKPSEESTVTDEMLHGMAVWYKEVENGWCFVITEYRYSGYIQLEKLTAETKEWRWERKLFITKNFADIHKEPNIKSMVIETLSFGSKVAVKEGNENIWAEVILADGRKGFIRRDTLAGKGNRYVKTSDLRKRIVKTAECYMGCQYRWGGKSIMGIDCSGLAFMSYFLNGIIIYRDSEIKEGFSVKAIRFEEAKEGDLLFFKGHVAIYLENGLYIHSTLGGGSNGVVINSIKKESPLYRADLMEIFIGAGSVF